MNLRRLYRLVALLGLIALATPLAYAAPTAHTGTHPTIRRGSTGVYVQEAQSRLNVWLASTRPAGYDFLPVIGVFGPQTERTVRAFQARSGLVADGVVGPRTWAALPQDPDFCLPSLGSCATRARIYLVALGDEGRLGRQIGCGDSLVPVIVNTPPYPASRPLTSALRALLALRVREHSPTGYYNVFYQSSLFPSSVVIRNRVAIIDLVGSFGLGGVCDDPRFEESLRETALQFASVDDVEIFINGSRLNLSGR